MQDRNAVVKAGLSALLPRLWRFAIVLSRDPSLAEDLVQATCLRALERAGQFDPATRLDRWTFTILASIWRNEMRRRALFARAVTGGLPALAPPAGAPADRHLMVQQALALVDRLPEAQRATVALVYLEEYTYREAAEALDIPVGTVMSRMHAARAALQRMAGPVPEPAEAAAWLPGEMT